MRSLPLTSIPGYAYDLEYNLSLLFQEEPQFAAAFVQTTWYEAQIITIVYYTAYKNCIN